MWRAHGSLLQRKVTRLEALVGAQKGHDVSLARLRKDRENRQPEVDAIGFRFFSAYSERGSDPVLTRYAKTQRFFEK